MVTGLKRIKQIAKEVRKFFENDPASTKQLHRLCFRASVSLAKRLQSKGIKAKVVHGYMCDTKGWINRHSWVVYKNKIIDLTATQFGYKPRVFVRSVTSTLYIPDKRVRDYAF
jgi:hypothetical protein